MRRPLIHASVVAVLLALLAVSDPVLAQGGTPATTPDRGDSLIDVLLDASVTALPAGASGILLEQWTFAPGAATLTMPPFPGLHWLIASDSTFAVTMDGDEHALAPGAGLVIPPDQEVVVRNTRETEALLLHGGIVAGYPPLQFDSRFITYRTPIASSGQLPTGGVRVVVERLMLAPGAALPRFTLAQNQWIGLGHGTVGVALEGERLPLYWEPGDEREVAFPNLFPAIAAGTEVTLRNAGQDQLVLYRLSVMPSTARQRRLAPRWLGRRCPSPLPPATKNGCLPRVAQHAGLRKFRNALLALVGEQRRDHRNSGVLGSQGVSEAATEVFFNRLERSATNGSVQSAPVAYQSASVCS